MPFFVPTKQFYISMHLSCRILAPLYLIESTFRSSPKRKEKKRGGGGLGRDGKEGRIEARTGKGQEGGEERLQSSKPPGPPQPGSIQPTVVEET